MKADLHIHSEHSFDALNSVDSIIKDAIKKGIDVIAIADHNEVLGAISALKSNEIETISAIEIDCFFNNEIIHVLGYGIDLNNPIFIDIKQNYINEFQRIGEERIKVINKYYNCDLNVEKIKSITRIGRPYTSVEITKILLKDIVNEQLEIYQTGIKSDGPLEKFYWDNLSLNKWGYVEMNLPRHIDIIKLIHQSGGVAICAHPKATIRNEIDLVQQLIDDNIDGFEVYSNYHQEIDRQFYYDICLENNLLMTMGSDFHGSTKPNITLGQYGSDIECSQLVNNLKAKMDYYRSCLGKVCE